MTWFKNETELKAINIVNAVLALVLFVSPWLFGFQGNGAAAWNAWITALLIGASAVAGALKPYGFEEWANLALGLWAVVAPWVLSFAAIATAMWSHVGVGLAVAILAAAGVFLTNQNPPAKPA